MFIDTVGRNYDQKHNITRLGVREAFKRAVPDIFSLQFPVNLAPDC